MILRPPGQIRSATLFAAERLVQQQRQMHRQIGVTWRDVAAVLVPQGVSRAAVKHTFKNLARTPLMQRVGAVKVPGASRAMVAYVPDLSLQGAADEPVLRLESCTRAWVAGR